MDLLDLVLDEDDAPASPSPKAEEKNEVEADLELLLEEFGSADASTKKDALKSLLLLLK